MLNPNATADSFRTATELRAAGVVGSESVKAGGITRTINLLPVDQADQPDGAYATKFDPQQLAALNDAAAKPAYDPRTAMRMLMQGISASNSANPAFRTKARAWLNLDKTFPRKAKKTFGFESRMKKHMETGRDIVGSVAKLAPAVMAKIDGQKILRQSLGQYNPKSQPVRRKGFNTYETLKQMPEVNANTVRHLKAGAIRSPNADSVLGPKPGFVGRARQDYSLLKAAVKIGVALAASPGTATAGAAMALFAGASAANESVFAKRPVPQAQVRPRQAMALSM